MSGSGTSAAATTGEPLIPAPPGPHLTANKTTEQTEKWTKLNALQQLYNEGFITQVEYRDRKSQIIDAITGTTTTTKSKARPVLPPVEVVSKPPPDFSDIKEEKALKHHFDPVTRLWSTSTVKVKIDSTPFAVGGLRKCYYLKDLSTHAEGPQTIIEQPRRGKDGNSKNNKSKGDKNKDKGDVGNPAPIMLSEAPVTPDGGDGSASVSEVYVAKISIDPFEDREVYFADVAMQIYSKLFAQKFNVYHPPKRIDFVKAWLLELVERKDSPLCGVERYIDGPYRKHNNNFGYVSEDERNTPQAFSHFTYEASDHQMLVCDIQGVGDLYTDPQIHTVNMDDTRWLGKGDLGPRGIHKFLATHQCNAICRYLRLPSINAKQVDVGTVPSSMYMKHHHVDVVRIERYTPSNMPGQDPRQPLLQQHQRHTTPGMNDASRDKGRPNQGCCAIL